MGLLYRKGNRTAAAQKLEKELTVVNRLGLHARPAGGNYTMLSCKPVSAIQLTNFSDVYATVCRNAHRFLSTVAGL